MTDRCIITWRSSVISPKCPAPTPALMILLPKSRRSIESAERYLQSCNYGCVLRMIKFFVDSLRICNYVPLIPTVAQGPVAQLVEHLTFNQVVVGSTPARLTSRLCPHRLVGLGHRPFTAATGVRIPLGMPSLFRHLQIFPSLFYSSDRHIDRQQRIFLR